MKTNYEPLEIPPFDDINISKDEMIKCKKLFEELATILRDRCGIMEIHIAYYTICKMKENIIDSMKINLEMVIEEKKKRNIKLKQQLKKLGG